jgi:hypothetical protein
MGRRRRWGNVRRLHLAGTRPVSDGVPAPETFSTKSEASRCSLAEADLVRGTRGPFGSCGTSQPGVPLRAGGRPRGHPLPRGSQCRSSFGASTSPTLGVRVNRGMRSDEDLAVRTALAEAAERAAKARATIAEYQSDEAVARRGARSSLAVAIVAAAGITIDGVVAAVKVDSSERPLGPYLVVAAGLALLGVLASWRTLHLENVAGSLGRIRRQLSVIEAHAAMLPADVATVVRAVATPRLLTEAASPEPWNEPSWPDATAVTALLQKIPPSPQKP